MAAGQPVPAAAPTAPTAPTAPVSAPVVTAPVTSPPPVLSTQAQQTLRLEAFQQLVTQLVNQVQALPVQQPSSWPAGGVSPQLQALVSALLQQVTAGQPLPQQLVSVQAWPSALAQAVLQQAAAASPSPTNPSTAPAMPGGAGPQIPPLQTWLVQQGVVQAQDGPRSFSLSLQVPQAWAQALADGEIALPQPRAATVPQPLAAGLPQTFAQPLPSAAPLSFEGSLQALSNITLGLVMQSQLPPGSSAAQALVQAQRTSAILQLEFQPLPASLAQTAQAAAVYLPAQMLPQELQAWLQGRNSQDPWLMMAQAEANGQPPRQPAYASEQSALCTVEGCQYLGRAICAQPFCSEMNYQWSVARAQRRL